MFNLIFAIDQSGLVGATNSKFGMPWHYPEDLAFYKSMTVGKKCIMGRKTYAAIGGSLPNRETYVVSSDCELRLDDAVVINDLDFFTDDSEWMVCGGVTIFEQFITKADYIYITRINAIYEGDVYYHSLDLSDFTLVESRTGLDEHLTFEKWKRNDN